MDKELRIKEMLTYIDPANLTYQEWVEVGMATKEEGMPLETWDEWSQSDPRYKPTDCSSRWDGFQGSGTTGATITHLAKQGGWRPKAKPTIGTRIIGFDDDLILDVLPTVDPTRPLYDDAARQAIEYLKHAFKSGDMVSVVTAAAWDDKREKWFPANAGFTVPRDRIIQRLEDGGLDGFAGDRNQSAGVWVRVNPMDGQGVHNKNTADFRHVLVESDDMALEKQIEIYRRLELPITCLTLSAGKSVHALVKVEAKDATEYAERVRKIFQACEDQGLSIDKQNKNPSRLTRFAGFERGEKQQSLLAVEMGFKSYDEWAEKFVLDDLPEYESLSEIFENPPELPPESIKGVLRYGEKMVLTGPSKAGKSFALIELAVALATGTWWMGRLQCTTNRVVYINLELPRANAFQRCLDVWKAIRGDKKDGLENFSVWNLRGTVTTASGMVDSIIKRHKAMPNPPSFYIVDPIYKLNLGDENAAKDTNELLREFDRLCKETNANLIYAHHHAKGSQMGKRALDRGSGSGVIGRDADAAIDLDFLFVPEKLKREKADYYHDETWKKATGLRVEMTLRNFEPKAPFNVWFKYPLHKWDGSDEFQELKSEYEKDNFAKAEDGKQKKKEETDAKIKSALERLLEDSDTAQMKDMEEETGLNRNRIKRFIDEGDEFSRDNNGVIIRKSTGTPPNE